VFDHWDYPDDDCMDWVSGFPTFESARDYARARTRASVEECRKPGQTPEQLRQAWGSFGECCSVYVVGADGQRCYNGRDEIDFFVSHAATATETDWATIEPPRVEPLSRS